MHDPLTQAIHACASCPRLRAHCAEIATTRRRAYQTESYWGRPVAGFGDWGARLWVVGLAPGAHGANRTGRVFTGDRSGDWLYRALYESGFANQAHASARDDGLVLRDAYVSCVVRCAPPDNRPVPQELARCRPFLQAEWERLKPGLSVVILLGAVAARGWSAAVPGQPLPKFAHGVEARWQPLGHARALHVLQSYHPSQQNTFTGRLSWPAFMGVFDRARALL